LGHFRCTTHPGCEGPELNGRFDTTLAAGDLDGALVLARQLVAGGS